jgi:hypothetical protein
VGDVRRRNCGELVAQRDQAGHVRRVEKDAARRNALVRAEKLMGKAGGWHGPMLACRATVPEGSCALNNSWKHRRCAI